MPRITERTTHVNHETGEVTASTTTRRYRNDEPSYIKLYLGDITYLHNVPKGAEIVLHELLKYVTYGTQEITILSHQKQQIASSTGLSIRTVDNRIQDLANKGIIERVSRGIYKLNPYLFGKGDWKTIDQLRTQNIHLQIVYDAETNTRVIRGALEELKKTVDNNDSYGTL